MTRGKATFVGGATLIAVITAFAWWTVGQIGARHKHSMGSSLWTVLVTSRGTLRLWANHLEAASEEWSTSDAFRHAVAEQIVSARNGGDLRTTKALADIRRMLQPFMAAHRYLGFVVMSPDGVQIAASRDEALGRTDYWNAQRETAAHALAGKSVVGLPFRTPTGLANLLGLPTRLPAMATAVPVRDGAGKVMAVFVIVVDPADEFSRTTQLGRIGATGETYAFDRKARLITESRFEAQLRQIGVLSGPSSILDVEIRDPGRNLVEGGTPALPGDRQPLTRMAASATSGQSGVDVDGYRDYRGVPVIGAWLWDDELGFGIATEQDTGEAFALLHAIERLVLLLLGVTIVASLGATIVLERQARALARSVSREREAVRSRDDLLAVVSHDLRNPLQTIGLKTVLLLREIPPAILETSRAHIEGIQFASERMARLISDLLQAARLEAGRLAVRRQAAALPPILEKSAALLEGEASRKRLRLEVSAADDLPLVFVDPDRIVQVLANLIGNAVKFAPPGGGVRVSAEHDEQTVRVSVADDGAGIPPENLARVFDRYWQAGPDRLGAGLGLFIAKGIVESHGGRIWAESEVARGSVFSFTVPTVESLEGTPR